MEIKTPWLSSYKDMPFNLEYPDSTMYELIEQAAIRTPDIYAYDFMGIKCTFSDFINNINICAKGLKNIGVQEGDKLTICLPNCPQALYMLYAANLIGAVANMVHPLSSVGEIEFFLKDSGSKYAITLDQFYDKFEALEDKKLLKKLIVSSIKDHLNLPLSIGYQLTQGRKIKAVPEKDGIISYKKLMKTADEFKGSYIVKRSSSDPAIILYSGGTTGTTKGILLSNKNLNALALQTITAGSDIVAGDTMLAVMPIFHGFGLGVCVHTTLAASSTCILVPRFNVKSYAKLLQTKKPNFIAGVPTLYEALLRNPYMKNVDLSSLKGVFSGGDSLSIELKRKLDTFLKEHGASIQVREGYGTTECVTASCLTPKDYYKEGSIGIPFPDTYYKIVKLDTLQEAEYGQEGEICLFGPTVMLGYNNNEEETKNTLKLHPDGQVWLHTGDLGKMDEEGFIYFSQRIKRMIVSSGYNIYPSQIENVIDSHKDVSMSCVIGVKDPLKIQKVKAFVVLKAGLSPSEEIKQSILEHCSKNIAKYALPYDIEFRQDLPKTLIGKVAYRELEQQEEQKNNI